MLDFGTSKKFDKILDKVSRKNPPMHKQIMKKMREVLENDDVEHYKNLRAPLSKLKRVHIGHFVLVFVYYKDRDFVSFENFDHHDKIYEV